MDIQPKPTEDFQIFDLIAKYKRFWPWFVISIMICSVIAAFYVWTTPKSYLQTSMVMITDDKGADLPAIFSDPIFNRNLSVKNEVEAFKSPLIIQNVVQKLNLTINYSRKNKMRMEDLYRYTPIKASFPGSSEDDFYGFQVEFAPDSSYILSKFVFGKDQINQTIRGKFNDTVQTPIGNVMITPTPFYGANWIYSSIEVSKFSIYSATKIYGSKLKTSLVSKDNSIIRLELTDSDISRAKDFLNMLLTAYNENWLLEKNKTTTSTLQWINERLTSAYQELKAIDEQLEQYKSQHLLTDVKNVGSIIQNRSTESSTKIVEINNQISIAKSYRDFLNKNNNIKTPLPYNSGLGSTAIETQIANYNLLMQERDRLISNSSENNPAIADLNDNLKTMRLAIAQSVDNQVDALNMQLSGLQAQETQMTKQIASNPGQERFLTAIERERQIKEGLYLRLLQKKEENEMSLVVDATNTRLISPPTGSSTPVAPKKMTALMIAFLFGAGIPGAVILGKEYLNFTIRDKNDLNSLSVPLLGVIALAGKSEQKDGYLLVRKDGKDAVNETIRMVRTNLDYLCDKNLKVVLFTSLEPGSGKTFIALNLAMTLALAGKKVALLDLDLRTATLSSLISMPDTGVVDFLSGRISDEHFIMQKEIYYSGFDVIPVGIIPPNPAEMLMNERFELLMKNLKDHYDYVFLDSTPLDMVADATILAKYAEISVFVVREGHTNRRKLPILEETYKKGFFKKMVLILNGAKPEVSYDKHHTSYSDKVRNVALLPRESYTPGKTKFLTEGKK